MRSIPVVVVAMVATVALTPAARAAALPGPAPWQGPVEVAHERAAQFSSVGSGAALAVFTDYGGDGSGAGQVSLARLPASG